MTSNTLVLRAPFLTAALFFLGGCGSNPNSNSNNEDCHFTLTIDHVDCTPPQSTDPFSTEGWHLHANGTASGKATSIAQVELYAITDHEFNNAALTCAGWGNSNLSGNCYESSGQPANTTWTASIETAHGTNQLTVKVSKVGQTYCPDSSAVTMKHTVTCGP